MKSSLNILLNDNRYARPGFKFMKADDELVNVVKKYAKAVSVSLTLYIKTKLVHEKFASFSHHI